MINNYYHFMLAPPDGFVVYITIDSECGKKWTRVILGTYGGIRVLHLLLVAQLPTAAHSYV